MTAPVQTRRWGRRRVVISPHELSLIRKTGRHVRRVGRRLTTGPDLYSRKVGVWLAGLTGFGTVFSWFQAGKFIAVGDARPFIHRNLLSELGSLWNHAESGAGSVTYLIARSYRVLFEAAVQALGGSSALAQRLYLSILFGLAASGVAYLVSALSRRPAAVWAAGVFAVANPFLLTRTLNLLIPIAIAVGGWSGGILIRSGRGVMKRGWLKLGLTTLLAAPMAYNPPMLAVLAGTIAYLSVVAMAAGRPGAWRRVLTTLVGGAVVAVAVNLWWLVPLYYTLLGDLGGAQVSAVLDVTAWQWTHRQNSIPAVFNLSANHAWGLPQYFPATLAYTQGTLSYILYLVPVAAVSSVLVVRRRRTRRVLWMGVVAAALLVFAGKGLHEPFASANKWMYENLPGWWMLREPAGKLGPLLITVYAVGLGALLDQLWRPSTSRRVVTDIGGRGLARRMLTALRGNRLRSGEARVRQWAAVVICAAGVAAGWPMFAGTVIPTLRPTFPSGHVTVPQAWYEAAEWVNTTLGPYQPGEGAKVLTLPVNDYYQMPTTWGYYGVDGVPASLLTVPMVNHQPGGYYGVHPGYEALLDGVTASVFSRDVDRLVRLVDRLGVSHVILRRDIDVNMVAGRSFVDPALLAANFDAMGLKPVFENEVAAVYHLGDGAGLKLYPKGVVADDGAATNLASLSAALKHLDENAVLISAEPGGDTNLESVLDGVDARVAGRVIFGGGGGDFEESHGRQLIQAGVVGSYASLTVEEGRVAVGELGDLVGGAGDLVVSLNRDRWPESAAQVGEGGGRAWVAFMSALETYETGHMTLSRALECEGGACEGKAALPRNVSRVGSAWGYLVTVSGVPVEGREEISAPCVEGGSRSVMFNEGCWQAIPVTGGGASGWTHSRTYLVVVDPTRHVVGPVEMVVRVVGAEAGEFTVATLRPRGETLTVGSPAVVFGETSFTVPYADKLVTETPDASADVVWGELGALSDCNKVDDATPEQAGLSLERTADGWVLGAERHSACVGHPFELAGDVPLIEVGLDITRRAGGYGRVCVYSVNLRRCLPGPSVSSMGGAVGEKLRYEAIFTVPAGERRFELFTYADSESVPGRTEVAYENLVVRPSQGQVHLEAVDADHDGSPVVVLEESYAKGWVLETRDGGKVSAAHVVADGWANGWVLLEDVDLAEVVVRFGPQRSAERAVYASVAALVVLGGSGAVRALRDLWRRRNPKP